ncbi:GNAT family N-acetyltransferase [Sphingosinicella sp. LHD-64]|uniref:GNAT family N-acetyltransferase n=1 Tax=Sphingosinicella sp. LHD-64 TaxID=3072139 RepID=UPI00280DFBDC|nr:GNAT family N-acetyltransferase [Sphingosinicella sp. LHD-64]MDQ8756402.1 GNAT family N-acetyltransferase [Sphingosinicella sp. LHD-64]
MAPSAIPVTLPLRVGARTLWRFRRPLIRTHIGLAAALTGEVPRLAALPSGAEGYLITALPAHLVAPLRAALPELHGFVRQHYSRHHADLRIGFDAYLAGFSAKTRSTLRRKVRRLADRSGGALDLRAYRAPGEMAEFHRLARQVSARTYQERLLDAGLPEGSEALTRLEALARRDAVRGWVLLVDDEPISYLHAPAEGEVLLYAHLGYDPDFADFSPGTVLQVEAMRQLMGERRFAWFDFTEGDGAHKRLFATGSIDSVDLLLLRRTPANLLLGRTLDGFDHAVRFAKRAAGATGMERLVRGALH